MKSRMRENRKYGSVRDFIILKPITGDRIMKSTRQNGLSTAKTIMNLGSLLPSSSTLRIKFLLKSMFVFGVHRLIDK